MLYFTKVMIFLPKDLFVIQPPEAEEVWTSLRMRIDLVNVSLELHPVQLFEHPEDFPDPSHLPSLARIDFIKSKFEFESFSDWSKTIDLVSEEVIFEDTRQKGNSSLLAVSFKYFPGHTVMFYFGLKRLLIEMH